MESELKCINSKIAEYESTIVAMECEIIDIQRVWYKKPEATSSASETRIETKVVSVKQSDVCVQAQVENQSVEVQSEPYDFYEKIVVPEVPIELPSKEIESTPSKDDSNSILKEQLKEALDLASERSSMLIKYESQIAEFQAKIRTLDKTIAEKDSQLARAIEMSVERKKSIESDPIIEGTDKAALKSTINSLQKMVNQKEETIARYQNLLKDDRDEHSKAAARFQEEIKGLREDIQTLQTEAEKRYEVTTLSVPVTSRTVEEPIKEARPDIEAEEKIARLCERASTLEADLKIAKELGERWHRLAEERLQHMDRMRERSVSLLSLPYLKILLMDNFAFF